MAHTGQKTRKTRVYFFDEDAADNEDSRERGGRGDLRHAKGTRTKKFKGFLCNRCVLCLFISLVTTFIAGMTLKVMVKNSKELVFVGLFPIGYYSFTLAIKVSSSLEALSSANSTIDDRDSEPFNQSYVPPQYILMNAKSYFGLDKHNFTVWFLDFGHWDMERLLETNITTDQFNEYVDYNIRKTQVSMRGLSEPHALGWALAVNMDGYGLAQAFDFQALGFLQEMVQRHLAFLKSADYAIIINMSYWSRMLTALFRPLIGDLLDRYELFGYDDWLPMLSERILVDQLPPGYTSYVED